MSRNSISYLFIAFFITSAIMAQDVEVKSIQENFAGNGAISVNAQGAIYVSEYGKWNGNQGNGTKIFKLDAQGVLVETLEGFKSPMGTATDSYGNLFVNNDNNMIRGQILKISIDGKRHLHATIEGWPSGMNIDKENNLYVPNYALGLLHKVTPQGEVIVVAEDERLKGCTGIDFDSQGNIIVSNFMTSNIYSIDKKGQIKFIVNIPNITVQGFGIGYITVIDDMIYATGIAVNKIFKISLSGQFEVIAGSGEAAVIDGHGKEASFMNPNGISANKKTKTLYLSEYGGSKVLRTVQLN